jgi:hypothetical protein
MDECSPTSVRRLVSGRGILEALDDSGLAAAVVSNDHSYWGKELDDGNLFVVKRPDAPDREFVQRSHRQSGQCKRGGGAVEGLMIRITCRAGRISSATDASLHRSQNRSIPHLHIMSAIDTPDTLRLVDHPIARNAAVATRNLPIGSVILTEQVFASALFSDKTGHRCDYCHRSDRTELELRILRCTGCGVQWYCGEQCMQDPPSSACI